MSRRQQLAELLELVENTATEARVWAARLEEAVERNRAEAAALEQQAKGGGSDAGSDDE